MVPVNLSHPASKPSRPMFFKQWLCTGSVTVVALIALCMRLMRYCLGEELLCPFRPLRASPWERWRLLHWATLEQHHGDVTWGYVSAMLCLCYGKVMTVAVAAASIEREAVSWLPCQPEKKKSVCSFHGSSSHSLPNRGSVNNAHSEISVRQLLWAGSAVHHVLPEITIFFFILLLNMLIYTWLLVYFSTVLLSLLRWNNDYINTFSNIRSD